jgi:hypothetical protein
MEPVLEELLESACPSIQYRIRGEILGQPASSTEMTALQQQILKDVEVQQVLGWGQPEGWLAWDFHGTRSLETGLRILCEKGLDCRHPAIRQALEALQKFPDRLERGIGKPGRILDETGFGGSRMIQATIFGRAGMDELPLVRELEKEALEGFRAVVDVISLDKITENFRGRRVFKPGKKWPSIYHLRLLAFTRGWRTPENITMLAIAMKRLVELSPLPEIYVRSGSRWIAPASFCMHAFSPDMLSMQDKDWMMWFHRMECLSLLGVIQAIPEFNRQIKELQNLLEASSGWFTKRLSHPYFTHWGAYTGLRLEPDWKHSRSRIYDLTFRSLLILHNYGSWPAK